MSKRFRLTDFDNKKTNIFFFFFSKFSFNLGSIFKFYKLSGLNYFTTQNTNKLVNTTKRCLSAVIKRFDSSQSIKIKEQKHKNFCRSVKNLKFYLYTNYLPCNGQKTRTNARTSKNRKN